MAVIARTEARIDLQCISKDCLDEDNARMKFAEEDLRRKCPIFEDFK